MFLLELNQDCQKPLGMRDRGIQDFQLTSSPTWLPETSADMARPYLSGWCADYYDPDPFLQVAYSFVIEHRIICSL